MDKIFSLLVLLTNLLVLKCQEEEFTVTNVEHPSSTGNPNYSFSYGVSDVRTGDMKTVWEEKEGDTVKGHYSVIEPDGSMRTVEYSANPKTGFTAVVNNDGEKIETQRVGRSSIEDKALRDYGKFYDFSEDADLESYMNSDRKKPKHPFDTVFKDYSAKKRPKYPSDLDASEFSHSISIKHPRDEFGSESESHSHFGLEFDPNCKTKHKKGASNNLYTNVVEFDANKLKNQKYPLFSPETFRDDFEKYEASNVDLEKYHPYNYGNKSPKLDPTDYEKLLNPYGNVPKLEDFKPNKYKYPHIPDIPSPDFYSEDFPPRPKKKYKPKAPEFQYPSEDLDEYMWVPKRKRKNPVRIDPNDYLPVPEEEEFDRPRYPSEFEDDDRPHREPPRGTGPKKEVIRKIVKKRKPGFNLLDILDI